MGRIFQGQSSLRIVVETKTDLSEAAAAKIKYRKPDGTSGEFAAVIGDAEGGIIFREMTAAGELDQAGWWVFWAWVEFQDGRAAAGEAERVFVWREGG